MYFSKLLVYCVFHNLYGFLFLFGFREMMMMMRYIRASQLRLLLLLDHNPYHYHISYHLHFILTCIQTIFRFPFLPSFI